jgi:ATP-dependent DNA helicase PIF1
MNGSTNNMAHYFYYTMDDDTNTVKVIRMPSSYLSTTSLSTSLSTSITPGTTTSTNTSLSPILGASNVRVSLAPEQQLALDMVATGKNVFMTGPAGSGKSLVIQCICDWATLHAQKIQLTAMTGCASLLLGSGATTIHSWSGIRLGMEPAETIISRIRNNRKAKNAWMQTKILVVDEVSMMSRKIFELLDVVGRGVRQRENLPFGGIQLVFSGDFFQLSPIADGQDESGNSGKYCFESPLWAKTFAPEAHIQFVSVYRQTDPLFQAILAGVRRGECTPEHIAVLSERMGATFDSENHHGCQPVELFPTRDQVNKFNALKFQQLSGEKKTFSCVQRTDCANWMSDSKPFVSGEEEVINAATLSAKEDEIRFLMNNAPLTPELNLKIGAAVMCIANLDLPSGICNGTLGTVVRFMQDIPVVQFHNGIEMAIPVHWWQSQKIPCCAVSQFPIVLAWSMSIHKSQGASLPLVKMDIGGGIFVEGQSYVALSRVRTLTGLYLKSFHPQKIRANPKVVAFYNSLAPTPINTLTSTLIPTLMPAPINTPAISLVAPPSAKSPLITPIALLAQTAPKKRISKNTFSAFECLI